MDGLSEPDYNNLNFYLSTLPYFRLIEHSMCLQELDLDDNPIGDLGGREIMDGLKVRGEADLPGIKMSVSHQMNDDTFATIVKLGSGLKKKKKKKGKKKVKFLFVFNCFNFSLFCFCYVSLVFVFV